MTAAAKKALHRVLQRLILAVPNLSEMRLASSKVMSFLRAWHYLNRNGIKGDYLEFGVFEGMSFDLSLRSAARFYPRQCATAPRFFAFDSFEGLPEPHALKDGNTFHHGEYRAGLECFQKNIKSAASGFDVRTVPGYFEQSLTTETVDKYKIEAAAFVNIDCDLYESTLTALKFVTPFLQTGSILFFDDWFYSGGDMTLGEPGACYRWLKDNPEISLVDFGIVGIMGKMFIVNRALPKDLQ